MRCKMQSSELQTKMMMGVSIDGDWQDVSLCIRDYPSSVVCGLSSYFAETKPKKAHSACQSLPLWIPTRKKFQSPL